MLRKQFFEKYKEVDLPLPMTPIAQDKPFDFRKLEKEMGFVIHSDIKGVQKPEEVINDLVTGFAMGDALFLSDARYWYLGGCDPYSMYVNNTTGKVIAVIPYENQAICLSDSISNLVMYMKCELDY